MAKAKKKKQPEIIKFPDKYRVVAADLSLKRPGFCILQLEKNEGVTRITGAKLFSVDNKTNTKKVKGQLLDDTLKAITFNFPDQSKDNIETYYVRQKRVSGHFYDNSVYEVVGITDWFLWRLGKQWYEVYPSSIKKLITGNGNAEKSLVAEKLEYYLGKLNYANDDESDSAAVAVSWLILNNEIKAKEV